MGASGRGDSWISYAELAREVQNLRDYCCSLADEQNRSDVLKNQISVPMLALLAYLQVFEAHGYETRTIFWFTPL